MVDPHCAHISNDGQQAARTISAESARRHWLQWAFVVENELVQVAQQPQLSQRDRAAG